MLAKLFGTGTKTATKVVSKGQPPPRMLSQPKYYTTSTSKATTKELAEQSSRVTPGKVAIAAGAVGTGALYVSGALTDGCEALLGEGNCEVFDAPRQLAGGIFSGLTDGVMAAIALGVGGVVVFLVLR
jgi:hypothetical protein